jgi:hypothetical protein
LNDLFSLQLRKLKNCVQFKKPLFPLPTLPPLMGKPAKGMQTPAPAQSSSED